MRATRIAIVVTALSAVFVLEAPTVSGQSAADYQALRKEVDLLRQRLAELQKEINELKAQRPATAAAPPAATPSAPVEPVTNVALNLSKAPIRGVPTARVTLVEVSDFECPFCARYSNTTSAQIVNAFVKPGKIRYAFVHLPIRTHKNAFKAAEASMCANDQGKFWEMHDWMFANQTQLARPLLPRAAAAVGLNVDTFTACLDSNRHAPLVQADTAAVNRLGVRATPTFYIGTIDDKTKMFTATHRIVGAKTFAVFQGALNAAVAATPSTAP
jgi:protein-disulfide isomerase